MQDKLDKPITKKEEQKIKLEVIVAILQLEELFDIYLDDNGKIKLENRKQLEEMETRELVILFEKLLTEMEKII